VKGTARALLLCAVLLGSSAGAEDGKEEFQIRRNPVQLLRAGDQAKCLYDLSTAGPPSCNGWTSSSKILAPPQKPPGRVLGKTPNGQLRLQIGDHEYLVSPLFFGTGPKLVGKPPCPKQIDQGDSQLVAGRGINTECDTGTEP
jgi:hypothetical protein